MLHREKQQLQSIAGSIVLSHWDRNKLNLIGTQKPKTHFK